MSDIEELKKVVNASSELSKRRQYSEALKMLDEAIARSFSENLNTWVKVLSRHASVIADEAGNLDLVRHYREQCLAQDPSDPLALSSLANVLFQQGHQSLAKEYAARAYQLAVGRDTEVHRALVESLLQTWPDIRSYSSRE